LGKQGRIIIKTSDADVIVLCTSLWVPACFLWKIEISSSQEYFCFLWLETPLYGQSLWYNALFKPTWWIFFYVMPVKYICYCMCCALVLANSRDDVTIDNILSHPAGPIPVSMFHEDGTMRKSCKSDLVKQFENEVSPTYCPTERALLSKVSALFFTFADSRQQRILYFSASMHACRNIHETRRVGLYIKGVSHGRVFY
jgi:hypothetical protein